MAERFSACTPLAIDGYEGKITYSISVVFANSPLWFSLIDGGLKFNVG